MTSGSFFYTRKPGVFADTGFPLGDKRREVEKRFLLKGKRLTASAALL
jgi:hypothetical protein